MSRLCVVALIASAGLSAELFGETQGQAKRRDSYRVSVTAYCLDGKTKSGIQTRHGIIAADPRVLPLGSLVRVSGLGRYNGVYTVADTGRAIKGREIDIFIDSCRVAKRFGRRSAHVRLLRRGPDSRPDTELRARR